MWCARANYLANYYKVNVFNLRHIKVIVKDKRVVESETNAMLAAGIRQEQSVAFFLKRAYKTLKTSMFLMT